MSAIFTYRHNDSTHTVQVARRPDGTFQMVVDGRVYSVDAIQPSEGAWRLQIVDESQTRSTINVHVAADEGGRFVKIGSGPAISLKPEDTRHRSRTRRATAATGEAQLTAQMPGQVVEVYVKPGDIVQSGQTLALLEAMKMEIRVLAPVEGVVTDVFVQKGDVVERDQRLINLHPPTLPTSSEQPAE